MSPRQRRGVLLLVLAAAGLIAVFALVSNYVSNVRTQVQPKVAVLRLAQDVRANQPFSGVRTETVSLPERWAPRTALRDQGQLGGLVSVGDLPAGTIVEQGMAISPPQLAPQQREIAILVDAETGVAGKVRPGDIVDIVATFGGTQAQQGAARSPSRSAIVVAGARIIDVGEVSARSRGGASQGQGASGGAASSNGSLPVTFALSVKAALKVTYAESFASEVRLALLRRGEQSNVPATDREYVQTP